MLKHTLIHPEINAVLARAGHYSRVLIADGNYPAWHTMGPRAELVSLNLMPGLVSCTDVLRALVTAIPIQTANTMGVNPQSAHALSHDPPIWNDFRKVFRDSGVNVELQPLQQFEFYAAVAGPEHVLTIQTGEQQLWANLLLTIGVRQA